MAVKGTKTNVSDGASRQTNLSPEPQLSLKLLGKPALSWQGKPLETLPPKLLAMLSYLALQNEAKTRHELAEMFWQAGKTVNVRVALSELSKALGFDDWLEKDGNLVRVRALTDVAAFEHALHKKRFSAAFAIWRGDTEGERIFVQGLELRGTEAFKNWLELERSRLQQLYQEALHGYLEELEAEGKYQEALSLARQLLEKDTLNESVHRSVMRLEHALGNTEAALAQFEQCRVLLKNELDIEPLEDTLELLKDIEQGSVSSGKRALLIKTAADIPGKPETLFGRNDLLDEALISLQAAPSVLLHGFGGTGKTALAATLAEKYLEQDSSVLWLQAGDDDPDALFDAIAKAFDAQQQFQQSRADVLQKLFSKHNVSLMVLDDVWNAYSLSKVMEALPADVPLLVTSRQRYPKLKRLDVGKLVREDALELLSHHAGDDLGQDENADKLCECLGDHAFALRIAGVDLAVDELRPKQLLQTIQDAPHNLKLPPELAEEGRESVAALLEVSLEALSDSAHEALMGFGALFTSSATPDLLALCNRRDTEATEDALIELQKRALVDRLTEPGSDVITYRLHDLVFSFVRANSDLRQQTAMRACHSFLTTHQHDFEALDAEINNLLGGVQKAKEKDDGLFVEMMEKLVVEDSYFRARGHSPRSMMLLKDVVDTAQALEEYEAAHHLATKLGDAFREMYGNYELAMATYQTALHLAEKLDKKNRGAILLSLIGLMQFHLNLKGADECLENAYNIAKLSKDDLALSDVLQHKGYIAGAREQWKSAQLLFSEAVEVIKRLRLNEPTAQNEIEYSLFYALLNLGEAERKTGDFSNSLSTRFRALKVAEGCNNQMWIAYALHEIGEMYHDVGERQHAQGYYSKALKLYEQNHAVVEIENLRSLMKKERYQMPGPQAETSS